MTRILLGFALLATVFPHVRAAQAEDPDKGYIIRVVDRVVYIDLGRRDSVQVGDLYDIVATDVLANPLSGDTLAVSPRTVGALRVQQVFQKMSLAEVVQLRPGQDPMMMRIRPIQDPERLAQIEEYLQRPAYGGGGQGSRLAPLVPGLQQFRRGQKRKGLALMTLEAVSLAAGIGYRSSSNSWKDEYDKLPAGLPASEYERYFHQADKRRRRSNHLFWLAGAVYAYHLVDLMWLRDGGMVAGTSVGPRYTLTLGARRDGAALVQLSRHF